MSSTGATVTIRFPVHPVQFSCAHLLPALPSAIVLVGGTRVRRAPHSFLPVLATQLAAVADEILWIASTYTFGLASSAVS